MKTHKIYPTFSFTAATAVTKTFLEKAGSVLYDRDGEMKGYEKDRYSHETVGYKNWVKVRAQVAFWGGDRYQPGYYTLLSVSVDPYQQAHDEVPDVQTDEITMIQIFSVAKKATRNVEKVGEVEDPKEIKFRQKLSEIAL